MTLPQLKSSETPPVVTNYKEAATPTTSNGFVTGEWEGGFKDWPTDCMPNGWMANCLPCVTFAQISVRIGADTYRHALAIQWLLHLTVLADTVVLVVALLRWASKAEETDTTDDFPVVLVCVCVVVLVVLTIVWIELVARLRTRVRERFRIDGSLSGDRCEVTFGGKFALAQMATQVKCYKAGSCDFYAPDAIPAYLP